MTKLTALIALIGTVGVAKGECPNACSGHGECGAFDECSCHRNWQGNDCSDRTCPFGHAHVDSPKGDLNMDGGELSGPGSTVVFNSEVYPHGTTEQYPDAQDNEGHFYMECSNKGLCDRKSGECECFDGYDGTSCQRASCPGGHGGDSEQCNGHGTCHSIAYLAKHHSQANLPLSNGDQTAYALWDAGYTRGCVCDPPFVGADCAERSCKFGVDPLFTSTGTALYQHAVAVNSCVLGFTKADDTVRNSLEFTTNGNQYRYSVTSTVVGSIVHQNVAVDTRFRFALPAFETGNTGGGSVPMHGNVKQGHAWLKKGAEFVVMNTADVTAAGCRYIVGVVDIDDTAEPRVASVYAVYKGETSSLKRCGPSGAFNADDAGSFDLFHVVNTFTLLFTDHHGEVYRTAPISAAVADYSAEVKAALEGLPNGVVSSVTVTAEIVDGSDAIALADAPTLADASVGIANEVAYSIEFTGNAGQLGALEIDSTPIRLGQQLQAGIDCGFSQEDNVEVDLVYSKVGYMEIGEDTTAFSDYVGNVGYFQNQVYAFDSTNAEVTASRENIYIYTRSSLVGVVANNDVIKIQDEYYVALDVQPDSIQLNTYFQGADVSGHSTAIYQNDDQGVDILDDAAMQLFAMTRSGSTFTFTGEYNLPEIESNGDDVFEPRVLFADDELFRVSVDDWESDDQTTYTFDCIFRADGASSETVADITVLEKTYTVDVDGMGLNCPSLDDWIAAQTAATAALSVRLYRFSPSVYTNGMYADDTRIFRSGWTASEGHTDPITNVFGGNNIAYGGSGASGQEVLFGNEINLITSYDSGTSVATLKNAVVTRTSKFEYNLQTQATEASAVGHDLQLLYVLDKSGASAQPYEYVSECSNRGTCEGSSGLCKCFKGYTGDNCNTISELYG